MSVAAALESRDRFLAFAFAGADLLVETSAMGRITFATGAFHARFGRDQASFLGRHVASLFAAEHQAVFALALNAVTTRGRIVPMLMRLDDCARSIVCVSALLLPEPEPRLFFTIGPAPTHAHENAQDDGPALPSQGAGPIARAAALLLQSRPAGSGGSIGLVELTGWEAAKRGLSEEHQADLRGQIAALLGTASKSALASEVSEGRFGVLSSEELDLKPILEQLEKLLSETPCPRKAGLETADIPLGNALPPFQAARALRFVLSRFADGGIAAANAAGGSEGLEGILARADLRARTLQNTIAERRFRILFQPVVSLADRRTHHYEALLRPIATPGAPAVNTQEFVVFAEAVGLVEELDLAVLEETLRILGGVQETRVAINLSGLSVQSARFRERAIALVDHARLPGRVLIELTETAEIEDMAAAASCIRALRDRQMEICLDDFGAGAAAFRYLRELPVDIVKIDGSFVREASRARRERGLVASMVELARTVGARTVAEMIETEEQARLMGELGVDFGQGWLFGRPGTLPGAAA